MQSSLPYTLRTYFTDIDKIDKNNNIDIFEFSNSLDFLSGQIGHQELNNTLLFLLQNGNINFNMIPTDPNVSRQPGRTWLRSPGKNVAPGGYCRHGSNCAPMPGTNHRVCRDFKCSDGRNGSSCGVSEDCQSGKCINYKCSDSNGRYGQACDWDHPCTYIYGCHFKKCDIIRDVKTGNYSKWGYMG